MEWALLLKSVLSLILVLGLLLVTLWAIKYLEVNSSKCCFMKKIADKKRLKVIEIKRLDVRNSLALVQCDNKEYLLLLGASDVLLESKEIKNKLEDIKNEK